MAGRVREPGALKRRAGELVGSLTTRGLCLLTSGVAAGVCAIFLDQRDLAKVATLLMALPLAAGLMLRLTRLHLVIERSVNPERVIAGEPATVTVTVRHRWARLSRVLLAQETLPDSLGVAPRFILPRLRAGSGAQVRYGVRASTRGRYLIGPLQVTLIDAFGLARISHTFTATDPLLVVPRVWPLQGTRAGGQWAGSGDSTARSVAVSGEDDLATREYRMGDDLRRVHWKSTARVGQLMVRTEEQPRQLKATVLLDPRLSAHSGTGPLASWEWSVSACASLAVHLLSARYAVRVITEDPKAQWLSPFDPTARHRVLDDLALVATSASARLSTTLPAVTGVARDGLVVCLLGDVQDADLPQLAGVAGAGRQGVGILLRVEEWPAPNPGEPHEIAQRRRRAAVTLRAAGWHVVEAGPRETISAVWARQMVLR